MSTGVLDGVGSNFFTDSLMDFVINLFSAFRNGFDALIVKLIDYIGKVVFETNYPQTESGAPSVFGEPTGGESVGAWQSAYDILAGGGIDFMTIGFVLWILAVILYAFTDIANELVPNRRANSEQQKKRIFGSFIKIAFWWQFAVMILAVSTFITSFLLDIGFAASTSAISQNTAVDSVVNNAAFSDQITAQSGMESCATESTTVLGQLFYCNWTTGLTQLAIDGGIGGLLANVVLTVVGLGYTLLMGAFASFWWLRQLALYGMVITMPVFFALESFDGPGFRQLSSFTQKIPVWFVTLAILPIPAALIIGVSVSMISSGILYSLPGVGSAIGMIVVALAIPFISVVGPLYLFKDTAIRAGEAYATGGLSEVARTTRQGAVTQKLADKTTQASQRLRTPDEDGNTVVDKSIARLQDATETATEQISGTVSSGASTLSSTAQTIGTTGIDTAFNRDDMTDILKENTINRVQYNVNRAIETGYSGLQSIDTTADSYKHKVDNAKAKLDTIKGDIENTYTQQKTFIKSRKFQDKSDLEAQYGSDPVLAISQKLTEQKAEREAHQNKLKTGFTPSETDTNKPVFNKELAELNNTDLNTEAMRTKAMLNDRKHIKEATGITVDQDSISDALSVVDNESALIKKYGPYFRDKYDIEDTELSDIESVKYVANTRDEVDDVERAEAKRLINSFTNKTSDLDYDTVERLQRNYELNTVETQPRD